MVVPRQLPEEQLAGGILRGACAAAAGARVFTTGHGERTPGGEPRGRRPPGRPRSTRENYALDVVNLLDGAAARRTPTW